MIAEVNSAPCSDNGPYTICSAILSYKNDLLKMWKNGTSNICLEKLYQRYNNINYEQWHLLLQLKFQNGI